MADYGYKTRRYVPQENRYETWDTRNNGVEAHRDGYWGKPTGFASNGEPIRDHVCRPIIVDAQGRRRPVIAYGNPENRMDTVVTKTETVIEQVYVPEGTCHGNISPRRMAPVKEYGGFNNGWTRPVSPDRPYKVNEFISQVQTEASQPTRTGPLSSSHWRQTHNSNGQDGVYGHGRNGVNTVHNPYDGRNEMTLDYKQEPPIITEGGWTRPRRPGWEPPTTLTKPTNDIGAAVEYLKEAAMSQPVTMAPTQRRFAIPTPVVPRMGIYTSPTIDSRDGLRRYGGVGGHEFINNADTYSSAGAIDSREAARKFHGQMT